MLKLSECTQIHKVNILVLWGLEQTSLKKSNTELFDFKISIKSKGGLLGIIEPVLGCPYRVMSAKCISKEGTLRAVEAESLLES